MKQRLAMILADLFALILLSACGAVPTPTPPYDPGVTPLTGAELEGISAIPNASGMTPCGVFDVHGHGHKAADLREYPNCASESYSVACLNGEAEWISDTISEVKLIGDQVVFTSQQDGACGLFAAP